jgi:hypothetical protein
MAISKTGSLILQWGPIVGAEQYIVNVYQNQQFSFSQTQSPTGITVSGLEEGDSIYADIFSQSGFSQNRVPVVTASQSIPVINFHESGKTFEFDSFTLDGISLDFSKAGHGYYATGNYENENSLLEFQLKNPRDESILSSFVEEPFLSGVTYQTSDPYSANYNSGSLYDFSVSITNNTLSRNYTSKIEVFDYYGSGITGFISLQNDPIYIHSLGINSKSISTGVGSYELIPQYSRAPTGVEYIISRDSNFADLIASGITSSTYNASGLLATSTTGFLSLTPYDWFGSGAKFLPESSLFINNTGFERLDSIINFLLVDGGDNENINAIYSATAGNQSGHYFDISIDPVLSGAFSSYSYSTGYLYPYASSGALINTGHSFNYFESRTGTHDTFYATLNLYQSGTNSLADSATSSIRIPYPVFIDSGISFNYFLGEAELGFRSEPPYTFSGIDILFSGEGSSEYITFSGNSFKSGSLYPHAKTRIVKASDHSIIYDSLNLSGAGLLPKIRTTPISFTSLEATVNTVISRSNDVPVEYVKVYQKPAFNVVIDDREGTLPESLLDILNFKDFAGGQTLVSGFSGGSFNSAYSGSGYSGGFFLGNTIMGHYTDSPPESISTSSEYTSSYTGILISGFSGDPLTGSFNPNYTGSGYSGAWSGYYESGRDYLYKFVPYNGFGSGHSTEAKVFRFKPNLLSQNTENITISNTTNINNIQYAYTIFSGEKEFHGNIDLNPADGCLALDVKRNVKISGWSGDSSTNCAYALDVAGNTIISGYQGNDWRESCYGTGSGHALTVLGHSKLSGNATIGTGENVVFEVLSDRSTFYHDLYVSGDSYLGTGENVVFEVLSDRSTFHHDLYISGGNLTVSGNAAIGINPSIPAGALHVRGGADQNFVIKTGQSHLSIQAQTDDNLTNVDMGLGFGAKTVYLKSDGNVGIGTSNPSHKLEVAGVISADNLVIGGLSPVLLTGAPPLSNDSYGVSGQMSLDRNYLYICNGPSQWNRIVMDNSPW